MRRRGRQERERLNAPIAGAGDSRSVLDAVLALDRMLVEISMRLYNVPRRERLSLRGNNLRLHRAVRKRQRETEAISRTIPSERSGS